MKLTIGARILEELLKVLSTATEKKSTIPVLGYVLIDLAARSITATNLEQAIRLPLGADARIEGTEKVLAPFFQLLAIAQQVAGDVILETDGSWLAVCAGESKFKLPSMPADNFPSVDFNPGPALLTLPLPELKKMSERVALAISREAGRYTLQAARLHTVGKALRLVATDGHRLALTERPWDDFGDVSLLLPASVLPLINSLSGEAVEIAESESTLFFTVGQAVVTTRKLAGQFPNYEHILPTEHKVRVTFSAQMLSVILNRLRIVAEEDNRAVCFAAANGKIALSSSSADRGQGSDVMDAAIVGGEIRIGLNADFLLAFLQQVTGDVTGEFKDENAAADFTQGGYRYLVMPIRL